MSLQAIIDKLNAAFRGSERKIVFWYDDKAQSAEEIDLVVLENARLHKLTGDNNLKTKYLLECEDKVNNYLVYAPFPRPSDEENYLADMVYYSELFYNDRVSSLCADLHIPVEFKVQLENYEKFWNAQERIGKFAALGIEHYTAAAIDIGLLAVVVGASTPSFEEVVKALVISDNYRESKYLTDFAKFGLSNAFWYLCAQYYGYADENPTLEQLIAMLLMTYTDHCCKGALPKVYQQFVSPKRNDVAVFVSNLMNNLMCKERYDALADTMGRKLKLSQYIVAEDVEQYFACDSFEIFDRLIIAYFAQKLAENGTALAPQYREIVKIRATKSHFSAQFSGYYRALSRADKLIVAIEDFSHDVQCTPDGMVAQYAAKWYHIDRYYRQFYAAFDRLEDSTPLLDLREMVENLYTNGYLAKLSIAWAEKLESLPSYGDLTGSKQYQFYKNVALPASHKERTVVIISDAFRFECAGELCRRLTVTPNVVSAELTPMLSVLPSYTRLGMAALLPHKNLTLTEDFQVLVDGCKCQSSGERGSILTAENREAVVLKYDEVKLMSREEVRKVCADKTLLYIYHDQIDARGDNAATENEVFTAADEAIAEIMGLVQKLTSNRGITSYIITADHGFLYKRDKLQEYDKVSLGKIGDERINKRYLLSKGNPPEIEGTLSYSMGYLDESLGETYVTVPRGVDIFKAPGGGQNYVHGGLALQEVVVPLLRVKTNEKKKETDGVKVVLTSLSRKITNLITYLDFIQTENISDTLHPVKLSVFFESESGERVSDEEIIVADKKNTQPASRQFHEKFTFRNRKYTKDEKYALVMMDLDAGVEVERNAFQIDIAFADDFGFNV